MGDDDAHAPEDQPAVAVCNVIAIAHLGLHAVDALARLQLEARRRGHRIALSNASPALVDLVDFAGLSSVLPCLESADLIVEVERQPEEREEPLRVKEERDAADPVAGDLDDL
jgi:STAS domain